MELVSLGRQSVYPRVYLVSYRGTSSAMKTMIAQRTHSGACSYWIGIRTPDLASRGAQEISSCITTFLKAVTSSECTKTELVMWSDSCGGQNRNIKMSLSLPKLVCSDVPFTTITQKFLESRHSFLPNDSRLRRHRNIILRYMSRNTRTTLLLLRQEVVPNHSSNMR